MPLARSVVYGLVTSILVVTVSVAVHRASSSHAPEAGEELVRPTSRSAARTVAGIAASSPGEDDGSIETAATDSHRPAARRGPATRQNTGAAPDDAEAGSSRTFATDPAASDPSDSDWSNPLSALARVFSSGSGGGAGARANPTPTAASSPPASPPSSGAQVSEVFFADSAETACQPGEREFVLDDLRGLYICIVWSGLAGTHAAQLTFLSPDGNVYQTMTLPAVTAQTVTSVATLPVAGTYISQHSLTGGWVVKVALDGRPVDQDHFILHPRS